jgi:hypothetical protein
MTRQLLIVLTLGFLYVDYVHAAAIAPDDLKPGANIIVDLPELGNSTRLADEKKVAPVQMGVRLPKNWRKDLEFPVIVFLGGGGGGIDTNPWWKITGGQNFILVGIDYTNPKARDPDFKNAAFALEVLGKAIAYDHKAVVLGGSSSGAYNIAEGFGSPNAKLFCAFCMICGGFAVDPSTLGARPLLLVAGEIDHEHNRVEMQIACYDALKNAKADVQMYTQIGLAHDWGGVSYPAIREWLYRTSPCRELRYVQMLAKLKTRTTLPSRLAFYDRKLAESAFAP